MRTIFVDLINKIYTPRDRETFNKLATRPDKIPQRRIWTMKINCIAVVWS